MDEFVAVTGYQRKAAIRLLRKELEMQYRNLNPLKLQREIDMELARLWQLSTPSISSEPVQALAG